MQRSLAPVAALLALAGCTPAPPVERPNVVVLLVDDAGYGDFGFQGSVEYAGLTPSIDSLARDGVRFETAYCSASMCSPSRAGLLTGRYQQRFGHENNTNPAYRLGLPEEERTLGDWMQDLGYATGLIGKWHLGDVEPYHPNRRGFDHFFGMLQGRRPYVATEGLSDTRVVQLNGEPTAEEGYLTDRLGRGAVEFIEVHRDRPFFLLVSFTAPHSPLEADAARLAAVQDRSFASDDRRTVAAMTLALDENVGLILDALRTHDLERDTLVVFLNDNGGATKYGTSNDPLRGSKGDFFEGGIRTPFLMRWPERIPAGRQVRHPVITLDLLPTVVAVAGGEVRPSDRLDGVDLMPLVTGQTDDPPHDVFFWRKWGSRGPAAVREGDWKLVRDPDLGEMLFQLDEDPGETHNRIQEDAARAEHLRGVLAAWEAQIIEPKWGPTMDDPSGQGGPPFSPDRNEEP